MLVLFAATAELSWALHLRGDVADERWSAPAANEPPSVQLLRDEQRPDRVDGEASQQVLRGHAVEIRVDQNARVVEQDLQSARNRSLGGLSNASDAATARVCSWTWRSRDVPGQNQQVQNIAKVRLSTAVTRIAADASKRTHPPRDRQAS